ncbi:hypothetical protein JCM10212_005618 [Sporobolomyces blumeae]
MAGHEAGLKRMLHKRAAAATTDTETTTATTRARGRTTATTATTVPSQHERPSFITASTRTTVVTTPSDTATTSETTLATTSVAPTTTADDETTTAATTRARVGTSAVVSNVASASSGTSAGAVTGTSSPSSKDADSSSESSGSHGGAIAGAIIAVIAVLLIGGLFFWWRRRRNARAARGSGTGLIGGGGSGGGFANNGSYKKHDEGDHGAFGASRDNSSLFGGREKTFSSEGMPGMGAGGDYGATSQWNNQPPQQWNQAARVQPSYPPASAPVPASTANLLSNNEPAGSSAAHLPMAYAAAGAAGIGAARVAPPSFGGESDYTAQHQSIEQRELEQELENRRQSMMNKAQAPPAIVAAAMPNGVSAEQSPFGDSEGQGEIRVVKGTFDPSLDDELVLYPGDRVQVLMKYDDGWALGLNLSSGNPPAKGVFPFDCLGEIVPPPAASEIRANPSVPPQSSGQTLSPSNSYNQGLSSPVNPANIPLPPPTPDLLSPIAEDDSPSRTSIDRSGPPQLAPLARSDSPLSPDFPPSALAPPSPSAAYGGAKKSDKLKRHSSLIASRDADLFVALGEVLDKERH